MVYLDEITDPVVHTDLNRVETFVPNRAPAFIRALRSGMVDQHESHGPGSQRQEVGLVAERDMVSIDQAAPLRAARKSVVMFSGSDMC